METLLFLKIEIHTLDIIASVFSILMLIGYVFYKTPKTPFGKIRNLSVCITGIIGLLVISVLNSVQVPSYIITGIIISFDILIVLKIVTVYFRIPN